MKNIRSKKIASFFFFLAFTFASTLCFNSDALADISKNEAKKIALRHSGVEANRANFERVDFDKGKNGGVYEVTFHTANRTFYYTISANKGRVLNSKVVNRNQQKNKR